MASVISYSYVKKSNHITVTFCKIKMGILSGWFHLKSDHSKPISVKNIYSITQKCII